EQSYYICRSIAEQALKLIPPQAQSYNSLQDAWAQPLPPLPADDKIVVVEIEDEERRFNLNAMRLQDGTIEPNHLQQFQRLLHVVQASPNVANAVADWLDTDSTVRLPGGAEAMQYPTYPCKNGLLDSVDELSLVQGVTAGLLYGSAQGVQVKGLAPTPAASPSQTSTPGTASGLPGLNTLCTVHSNGKINVNTANVYVLQSIAPSLPPAVAAAMVTQRQEKPFQSLNDLLKVPGFNLSYLFYFQSLAGVTSSVYRVTATVQGSEGSYLARVYVQLDPATRLWIPLVWEVHS
ncbi:MAG TPA: general secretion pathway protein GspK, partial [Candidatus Xenobia bacterium]